MFESYAEYYHEATKYFPKEVMSGKHVIDFNKQPSVFKEYVEKKALDISYLLPLDRNPFSDIGIKSPENYTKEEKSLSALSKLLYFSNGITAIIPLEKPFYMRSSPSAGGLYPTEIYVIAENYFGLENGIYNYHVLNQTLISLEKGDFKEKLSSATFKNPAIEKSNLFLILSGVFYRSSWRYQDRAYRRICLDTGHILGNIDTVSTSCGFQSHLIGGFNDEEVNKILKLNEDEEQVLVVVALSDLEENIKSPITALPSKLNTKNLETKEGKRLLELHNRSRIERYINIPNIEIKDIEEKLLFSPKVLFDENNIDFKWEKNLFTTILNRRSTRAFSGESISKEKLEAILDFSYDINPEYFDRSLLQTFIAINNIDGIEDGCYFYSHKGRYLRQVRFKNLREEVYYLCLQQDIGYRASAAIFHTADLNRAVFKYGERAYRYLHLDAGHIGERLNLAAINLNLGASGIGGFFDDRVNDLLGIPEHEAIIYITVLGVPDKTN